MRLDTTLSGLEFYIAVGMRPLPFFFPVWAEPYNIPRTTHRSSAWAQHQKMETPCFQDEKRRVRFKRGTSNCSWGFPYTFRNRFTRRL